MTYRGAHGLEANPAMVASTVLLSRYCDNGVTFQARARLRTITRAAMSLAARAAGKRALRPLISRDSRDSMGLDALDRRCFRCSGPSPQDRDCRRSRGANYALGPRRC